MNKIICIFALVLASGSALAAMEYASYQGREMAGGSNARCFYRSMSGYEFAIIVQNGMCPVSVRIDVETGQVEK